MKDKIKEILEILKKCYDLKDENFDNYITLYQLGTLLDYITNLQQENKGLKEELNRMFNRKVNAIKYIGREMIHDALYPASKVDGMKLIELLNGGDEE